jgi:hypothetical protein
MVTVDVTTFANEDGTACDMNGWTLVSAANACKDTATFCTPSAGDRNCATTNLCVQTSTGNWVMRCDKATNNNTNNVEEWRLYKTFDFSNINAPDVCFWMAGVGLDADEAVLVYVSDSSHQPGDRVFCQNGMVRAGAYYNWFPFCATLPAWAANNSAVTITFIVHSENGGDILYLDNLTVHGWPTQCAQNSTTILTESFAGCDTPITDGWNGWTVSGAILNCDALSACQDGNRAYMSNGQTLFYRFVDASNLDGNIQLCFYAGDWNATDANDMLLVEYSIDNDVTWHTVWGFANNFGANGTCHQICVNLSDIDPQVNRHPNLGIGFVLQSDNAGHYVILDGISLSGSTYCAGDGTIGLGSFAESGTPGNYSMVVTDVPSQQLAADIQCHWDSLAAPAGQSTIYFVP